MDLVPSEEQLWLELPEPSPLSPRPPIMGLLVRRALEHTGICALLTQLRAGGLKSLWRPASGCRRTGWRSRRGVASPGTRPAVPPEASSGRAGSTGSWQGRAVGGWLCEGGVFGGARAPSRSHLACFEPLTLRHKPSKIRADFQRAAVTRPAVLNALHRLQAFYFSFFNSLLMYNLI